jgi:hypothetical protein
VKYTVCFDTIAFEPFPGDGLDWQVQQLTWALPGGAQSALLNVEPHGALAGEVWLERLAERLGCPLRILDPLGRVFWGGWVEQLTWQSGNLEVSVTLAGMSNRAVCRYPLEQVTAGEWGRWAASEWQQNDASVRRYGRKESLITLPMADARLAEQTARAHITGSRSQPRWQTSHCADHHPGVRMRITARGWWQRLDWICDQEPRGLLAHLGGGKTRQALGSGSSTIKLAQSFRVEQGFSAGQLWLRAAAVGSPQDALRCCICADDNSRPGVILAESTLPAWAFSGGFRWLLWEPDAPCALAAATHYWLVLEREGALDGQHYFVLESDDGPGYAQGELRRWDAAEWQLQAEDLRFCLPAVQQTSELIAGLPPIEFLQGVRVWQSSGVWHPQWRALEKTLRQTLESWLALGTQAGSQLSAVVDAQRIVQVFSLPRTPEVDLQISQTGQYPLAPEELLGRALALPLSTAAQPLPRGELALHSTPRPAHPNKFVKARLYISLLQSNNRARYVPGYFRTDSTF